MGDLWLRQPVAVYNPGRGLGGDFLRGRLFDLPGRVSNATRRAHGLQSALDPLKPMAVSTGVAFLQLRRRTTTPVVRFMFQVMVDALVWARADAPRYGPRRSPWPALYRGCRSGVRREFTQVCEGIGAHRRPEVGAGLTFYKRTGFKEPRAGKGPRPKAGLRAITAIASPAQSPQRAPPPARTPRQEYLEPVCAGGAQTPNALSALCGESGSQNRGLPG